MANIGLVRAVPFPATVTHYVSTGAVWERTVAILDAEFGGEYGRLYAPRRTYARWQHARTTRGSADRRLAGVPAVHGGQRLTAARRERVTRCSCRIGAFTDAAGHMANSDIFSTEFNGKIYVDDELELDMFASVFMNTTVPAGKHRFRVVTETKRENLFWQRSTGVKTEWGFDSDTPDGRLRGAADARHRLRDAAVADQHGPRGRSSTSRWRSRCRHGEDAAGRQAQRRDLVGRRPDLAAGS